jgi:hypothetical protein
VGRRCLLAHASDKCKLKNFYILELCKLDAKANVAQIKVLYISMTFDPAGERILLWCSKSKNNMISKT